MKKQTINQQQFEADQDHIELFMDVLWMEQGLSRHTLSAYQTDLKGLAKWAATDDNGGSLRQLQKSHLQAYEGVVIGVRNRGLESAQSQQKELSASLRPPQKLPQRTIVQTKKRDTFHVYPL